MAMPYASRDVDPKRVAVETPPPPPPPVDDTKALLTNLNAVLAGLGAQIAIVQMQVAALLKGRK